MRRRRKISAGSILYWILAVMWLVTSAFPLYFTLISSVKEDSEIFAKFFVPTTNPQWMNFARADDMSGIIRAIFNSFFVSIGTILLVLVLVIPLAYVIARKKMKHTGMVSTYYLVALMVPIQCIIVPIIQSVNRIHGQNNMLVLIMIYTAINMPMTLFILTGTISGISNELDESAAMDGCKLLQMIYRIIVPIAKPGISTCVIITFLNVYNELAIGNVLISKKEYQTISVALLNFKSDFGVYYSVNFAAILLCIIPILFIYIVAQEKVEKGISAGALKG